MYLTADFLAVCSPRFVRLFTNYHLPIGKKINGERNSQILSFVDVYISGNKSALLTHFMANAFLKDQSVHMTVTFGCNVFPGQVYKWALI